MSEQEYDCHDCSDTGVLIVRDHNDSEAEVPCPECGVPIHIELARYKARATEAERMLLRLAGWAACAVEDTTISAETYWRELPRAIKDARAFLEGKP